MAQTASNDSREEAHSNNCSTSTALNPVKIKQEKIDLEIENKIELLMGNIKSEPPDNGFSLGEANGHIRDKRFQEESDDDEEDSNDSDSSSQEEDDGEEEENSKKNIEPVKSSNEILTELFQVFNAAPPEELLDDKNLIKKAKKHKKEKKKKRKKNKSDGADVGLEEIDGKHKKKKKHKHKNKDDGKDKKDKAKNKDKERDKSKDREKSKTDKNKVEIGKTSESSRNREISKSKEKVRINEEKAKKSCTDPKRQYDKEDQTSDSSSKRIKIDDKSGRFNSFYNGYKERDAEHSRGRSEREKTKIETREKKSRRHSDDSHSSETSLSDEETYLKEKETRSSNYKRTVHNSFYDGVKRSRSRDKERDRCHSRDRYRDRDRDRNRDRDSYYRNRGFSRRYHSRYSRSRSHSRSRSRSRDLGIDKKRLLEIARKNAISMFKRGNLPGCDNMSQEIKDKVLLKMRYGGRTVEDLTAFCKKISNGENLSDLSSDEDSDVDKAGNSKAFHHPFQLKEREPIVMHIRNSKPILPVLAKTEEQTKAITMQFPVSSGQQHRMTEHWVPVETKESLAPLPVLPAATQSTTIFKSTTPKNALGKPLPLAEEQEPAFKAVPVPTAQNEPSSEISAACPPPVDSVAKAIAEIPIPADPAASTDTQVTTSVPTVANIANVITTPAFVPDVPVPSTNSSVFPQANSIALDVSSIISKRLNAMRRLQENPMDSEAIKMMYSSQREMSSWASSKHIPGQFTGSTGVNVLKPNELNSGPQVWARRDQLTSTKPVTGGMGMHLLQKMGWKPGEGLGREKNGSLQPLLLDVKLDKRGLVASEDCNRKGVPLTKRRVGHNAMTAQQSLEEKHPVCLLNELTSKRKWTPPMYTLVNEKGPSHSKMFLFSVQVNGQTFTPSKACNTKKEAKMIAAKYCLQQIGILPAC